MKDINYIVAANITALRQSKGLTQAQLAEQLNYSDKSVSKWERGASLPTLDVLLEIADLFGVPLDYLVRQHDENEIPATEQKEPLKYRPSVIIAASMLLVYLIALFVFLVLYFVNGPMPFQWMSFIYAIPASLIVWLVMNSIWFNRLKNYLIISLLMWSVLVCVHLTVYMFGINISLIYLLGAPGQLIILLWSFIKKRDKKKK